MGAQRALGRSAKTWESLDASLVGLVDRLTRRMRAADRVCRTVILRMRFSDFSRATRSHTLSEASDETETILATARALLLGAAPLVERDGITLIGVTLTNLDDDGPVQLVLPFEDAHAHAIDRVVDDIRERFGTESITRATLLGRDQGISVPLLPD